MSRNKFEISLALILVAVTLSSCSKKSGGSSYGSSGYGGSGYGGGLTLSSFFPGTVDVNTYRSLYINGSGFSASGNTVSIGGVDCKVSYESEYSITCNMPSFWSPGTGKFSIVVKTAGGGSVTSQDQFEIKMVKPYAWSVSPNQGSVLGGTTVTIEGWDFHPSKSSVTIGGTPCAITARGADSITCVTGSRVSPDHRSLVQVTNETGYTSSVDYPFFSYEAVAPVVQAPPVAPLPWWQPAAPARPGQIPAFVPAPPAQPAPPAPPAVLARPEGQALQHFDAVEPFSIALHGRDPAPGEGDIYHEMIQKVKESGMDADSRRDVVHEILFLEALFRDREPLLHQTRNNPRGLQLWNPQHMGVALIGVQGFFHAEYASEAGGHGQAYSMKERLNYIHGVWTQSYLKARADHQLPLYFMKAFRQGAACTDGKTEGLINSFIIPIQLENYDLSRGCHSTREYLNKIYSLASAEASWLRVEMNREFMEAFLRRKVGTHFNGHVLDQAFVDEGLAYAEHVLMIF